MKLLLPLALATALMAGVPYERIRQAAAEPDNWLTYSGNYAGHRHTTLNQINAANVARLKVAWVYQIDVLNKFATSPLVVDGIVYISEPMAGATALDARTGRPLWKYRRNLPNDIVACCGRTNRGMAILGDTLYLGTLDAHLVALDARTGRVRWDSEVIDYRRGYAITGAPLAVRDKILVGVAGAEFGIRGLIDAYDANTGKRAWRFWTVPGPGEPGNETWAGKSWETGGASTWITGSYDPDANLVYWGTGNPGPDYDGSRRAGDNLYSCSLVALDADSGKLRWHFQFTPHDVHDWDSTHVPVLFDGVFRERKRPMIAVANRNGFYYVLDRVTGEYLSGTQYGRQDWAKGLDDRGRPILLPDREPTRAGRIAYPGMHGATNWFSPAYNPQTKLFFVAVREEGVNYYTEDNEYRPGRWFGGGGVRGIPGVEPTGSVKALDAETGRERWEFKLHAPPWAGLLSTAGGVVFGGTTEGFVFALDARTGKSLWRFPTGGAIFGNPISFLAGGKQHVAMPAGHALFAFALD